MPKTITSEPLPAGQIGHPAAEAWHLLRPDQVEPERIEVLALNRKVAVGVYRLWGAGRDGAAMVAKRSYAASAGLERLIYEDLLAAAAVPVLRCFGLSLEPAGEFAWLFLEDAGTEHYSPASAEHRGLAGRFLAALHCIRPSQALRAALPDRSPRHYSRLIHVARTALQAQVYNPVLAAHEAELLQTLAARCELMQTRWEELQKFFEDWPPALVHGDFVAKNLRIRSGARGPELLVFDWEMAGWGVPAVDLAQSLGKTASPDLELYGAARRYCDPRATSDRLERLATYGNLFRLAAKISWEALSLKGTTYEQLVGPITNLGGYERQLAAALRAVNWTAND